MKNSPAVAAVALAVTTLLAACSPDKPPVEPPRPVRTSEIRYGAERVDHRYVGTVQSRYEVAQAFRVPGKVAQRRVEVGQVVHEGDVLAVLDDTDYRLAAEAANEQLAAALTRAGQADSDEQRLKALKSDGSVSAFDDEHARSGARTAHAAAQAETRQVELATNRLKYTVLRASRSGVVTAVNFEVGQVVAEGQPVVSIADPGTPEIVVDVPEDQLATFKAAHFKAALVSAPGQGFDVALRELSPQAVPQTRTYRARLKPMKPRLLPLGATATLLADHVAAATQVAAIPAAALTQLDGQPAVWAVRRAGQGGVGTVDLERVAVQGYRDDQVLVSGPAPGELVVTAGVQKMAPGLKVALPGAAVAEASNAQAVR